MRSQKRNLVSKVSGNYAMAKLTEDLALRKSVLKAGATGAAKGPGRGRLARCAPLRVAQLALCEGHQFLAGDLSYIA